jgi:hypothetical protein
MLAPIARADVLVDPANMGNWSFANADGSGTAGANPTAFGGMVTGPGVPPLGTGSAELATGNGVIGGDGAEILSTSGYAATPLSALTALSYSTYVTSNNGQQFPYLSIEISTGVSGTPNDVLFFEPPYQPSQGTPVLNTWQTWNALAGGWWDNNGLGNPSNAGVVPLSTFETAYPDATIENYDPGLTPATTRGGIALNVGFATTTSKFVGYVDNFTIGVNGGSTTYNFDPTPTATPEPGTLALLGSGLLGAAAVRRRRRSRGG